jgi:hypothetical protein
LLIALATCLLVSPCLGSVITIPVTPEGDGIAGRERWGYGSGWYDMPYSGSANPNLAWHWYSSPDGQNYVTYLQFALAGLPAFDSISSAKLFINVVEYDAYVDLYHASDSSLATGDAAQKIGGNAWVAAVSPSALGWYSQDVTSAIQSDRQNGYSWSAFSVSSPGYTKLAFSSGETANAAYLRIDVAPEPGTLVLLAAGAAACLVCMWRKVRLRLP